MVSTLIKGCISGTKTPAELAAAYGLTLSAYEKHHKMILAHGIIMGLAFAIMYPLGAVIIKGVHGRKNTLWFHAGWQVTAYILTLAGLGLGVWLVVVQDDLLSPTGHPIIGLIVIGLILLLPPLGWIHHKLYVATQSRSLSTYLHRWIGRVALVAGGINGGLGLYMAHDTPTWGIVAYTACASAFFTLWFGVLVLGIGGSSSRVVEAGEEAKAVEEGKRGQVMMGESGRVSGDTVVVGNVSPGSSSASATPPQVVMVEKRAV